MTSFARLLGRRPFAAGAIGRPLRRPLRIAVTASAAPAHSARGAMLITISLFPNTGLQRLLRRGLLDRRFFTIAIRRGLLDAFTLIVQLGYQRILSLVLNCLVSFRALLIGDCGSGGGSGS